MSKVSYLQESNKIYIRSLVIFNFLELFNEFELVIKETFAKSIKEMNREKYNKLFFYVGALSAKEISVDYVSSTIKRNDKKFCDEILSTGLTPMQIVKIEQEEKLTSKFDFDVSSINNKNSYYTFYNCTIKIISMRNILSHELKTLNFKDKDVIERISLEKIKENNIDWLENIELKNIESEEINILSNYIFMKKIINTVRASNESIA